MKHSVHPLSEGGHRRFLLAVSLGQRHGGGVGRGGGASGRQHAGGVLGLQGALQGGGGVSDGPDFGLGFGALQAWVGVEGRVLLVDGRECGTFWRQPVFPVERLRGVALREARDFPCTAVLRKKRRPGFTV